MVIYTRAVPYFVDKLERALSTAFLKGCIQVMANLENRSQHSTDKGGVPAYAESTRELCSLLEQLSDEDRNHIMNWIKSLLSDE